nr:MAG TPA: hypothetical protein [Caudoviricetes sp.]
MAAREKEALIENAIRESNTISEECKQELLKYYQKKKLYMKNGVFSLEGDKKTYEDMIFELQDENKQSKDNWNKLKEYIKSEWTCFDNESVEFEVSQDILDKMQKLEEK